MKTKPPRRLALTGLVLATALLCVVAVAALRNMILSPADRMVTDPRADSPFEANTRANAKTGWRGEDGTYRQDATPLASRDGHDRYVYDADADRLTLDVRDAPLAEVLAAVSKRSGLIFDTLPGLLLKRRVTVQVERLPLEEAVRSLLRGFNKVFFYDQSNAGVAGRRLTKVLILSASGSEAARQARADLLEDPTNALLDAVARKDSAAVEALAQALRDFDPEDGMIYPGSDVDDGPDTSDREKSDRDGVATAGTPLDSAVEALLASLNERDEQGYVDVMRILREFAPQQAAAELMRRLSAAYAEGRDQNAVIVAWGLGAVGSHNAVALLEQTYESTNQDLQSASAGSLQQIRLRIQGTEEPGYLYRPPFGAPEDEWGF